MESYLENSSLDRCVRNLDVTRNLVVPVNVFIQFIIRSNDVLHSWSVPSLGLKIDATPGRLGEVGVLIDRVGVFYGICSEICGLNHSYIPIVVEAVPFYMFLA